MRKKNIKCIMYIYYVPYNGRGGNNQNTYQQILFIKVCIEKYMWYKVTKIGLINPIYGNCKSFQFT